MKGELSSIASCIFEVKYVMRPDMTYYLRCDYTQKKKEMMVRTLVT